MERNWFRRGFIAAVIIVAFLFGFLDLAHAAPTVCQIGNGCTGTSTAPAYGQFLVGGKNGEFEYVSTSTIGGSAPVQSVFGRTGAVTAQTGDYTTSQVTEGSNLYFTNARAVAALTGQNVSIFTNDAGYLSQSAFNTAFDNRLSATTSLPKITTLAGLSLPYSQLTGTPDLTQYLKLSDWYATTTDQLREGSTNLYFTNTRADARFVTDLAATTSVKSITTLPTLSLPYSQLTGTPTIASSTLLSDNNTFSGVDKFTNSSSDFSGTWQTFSPSHFQPAGTYLTTLGNYASTTGTAISFSTSTASANGQTLGLTIAPSANGILFTPTISGTLSNAGLAHSTIVVNSTTLTLGDSGDTITAASSTLLANNNTFSGTDTFNNTISGSVTGNAGTATKLATARAINNVNFDGTAPIMITAASSTALGDSNTFSGTDTFNNTIIGGISGNAGSATKLQTARTINGVSFDGTANIVVASTTILADNNTFSGTNTFTACALQIGSGAASWYQGLDGSNNFGISATQSGCVITSPYFTVAGSGFIGINNFFPQQFLDINGNISIASTSLYMLGETPFLSASSTLFTTFAGINAGAGVRATATSTQAGSEFYTAFGFDALQNATSSNFNTTGSSAFGYEALQGNSASNLPWSAESAFGYEALKLLTTGQNDSAFGALAGENVTTAGGITAIGANALVNNTSGTNNTGVGTNALQDNNTGNQNTAMGEDALQGSSVGAYSNNTVVGYHAGSSITTGGSNEIFGSQTGSTTAFETGSNNIMVGYDLLNSVTNPSNTIDIGNLIFATGASGQGTTIAGTFSIASSTNTFTAGLSFGTGNGVCFVVKATGTASSYVFYYFTAAGTQVIGTTNCTGSGTTTIIED